MRRFIAVALVLSISFSSISGPLNQLMAPKTRFPSLLTSLYLPVPGEEIKDFTIKQEAQESYFLGEFLLALHHDDEEIRIGAIDAIGPLVAKLIAIRPVDLLLKIFWFPSFDEAVGRSIRGEPKNSVVDVMRQLVPISLALMEQDPTGTLFLNTIYPILEEGFSSENEAVSIATLAAFQRLLSQLEPSADFLDIFLPLAFDLYENAPRLVGFEQKGLLIKLFDSLGHLSFYTSDKRTHLTKWMTYFEEQKNSKEDEVEREVAISFSGFARYFLIYPDEDASLILSWQETFLGLLRSKNAYLQEGATIGLSTILEGIFLSDLSDEKKENLWRQWTGYYEMAYRRSPHHTVRSLMSIREMLEESPSLMEDNLFLLNKWTAFFEEKLERGDQDFLDYVGPYLSVYYKALNYLGEKKVALFDRAYAVYSRLNKSTENDFYIVASFGAFLAVMEKQDIYGEEILSEPLVMFKYFLENSSARDQLEGARALAEYGKALFRFDPTGVQLERDWIGIWEQFLKSADPAIRVHAAQSLGFVVEEIGLSEAPKMLFLKWFKKATETYSQGDMYVKQGIVKALGRMIASSQHVDLSLYGFVQKQILPFYKTILSPEDSGPLVVNAAESLDAFADFLLGIDETGTALQQYWIPLWKTFLNRPEPEIRMTASYSAMVLTAFFDGSFSFIPQETLVEELVQRYPDSKKSLFSDVLPHLAYSRLAFFKTLRGKGFSSPWEFVVNALLLGLEEPGFINNDDLLNDLVDLFLIVLQEKETGLSFDEGIEIYLNYFKKRGHDAVLPKKRVAPKDLLALILIDFSLENAGLPVLFSEMIRKTKRPPAFQDVIPFIKVLKERDTLLYEAILGYSKWSQKLTKRNDVRYYWGSVRDILFFYSRNKEALVTLGLEKQTRKALTLFLEPNNQDLPPSKIRKLLQQEAAEFSRLIVDKVSDVFHFSKKSNKWNSPEQKELNVLLYVARDKNLQHKNNPLNKVLRTYFRERVYGSSREDAIARFYEKFVQFKKVKSLLKAAARFLDEDGYALKRPEPLRDIVFISGLSLAEKRRSSHWFEMTKKLWRLGSLLGRSSKVQSLLDIMKRVTKKKNPSPEEQRTLLTMLKEWFDKNNLNGEAYELGELIQFDIQEIEHLLERHGDDAFSPTDEAPVLEAEIYVETDPIEIMHLGWPKLGNSCFDLNCGSHQEYVSAHLVHPYLSVVYIRNPEKSEKPLARLVTYLDPSSKTLLVVSPIKTSNSYDYIHIVSQFLINWADLLDVRLLIPEELDPAFENLEENLFLPQEIDVDLKPGWISFYSDATSHLEDVQSATISGWMYHPLMRQKLSHLTQIQTSL